MVLEQSHCLRVGLLSMVAYADGDSWRWAVVSGMTHFGGGTASSEAAARRAALQAAGRLLAAWQAEVTQGLGE